MEQNRHSVVVVFPDAERAKWYIDNCFEFYVRVIVVSMDGVYPEHPHLLIKLRTYGKTKEPFCCIWSMGY